MVKKWKNRSLKVACSAAGAESRSPSQAESLSRGFKLFSCLLQLFENCVGRLSCACKSWSVQLLLVGKCWCLEVLVPWAGRLPAVSGHMAGSSFPMGKEMDQLSSA